MKRVDARDPAVLAVLGEIDAGEDADRRADERRDADDHDAAEDRVGEAAGRARRRRHLREQRRRQRARSPSRRARTRIHSRNTMPKAIVASDIDEVEPVDEQAPAVDRRSARLVIGASSRRLPFALARAARAAAASSASTMNVSTNSTRPSAISDARCTGSAASLNSLASAEAIELPGSNSDGADPVRVADDERHRHRLAERAAEAEHDAADHADLGVRQHDVPDDFPGRRADAVRRFLEHRRHDLEHVAHHRGDERNHHDRQDDARPTACRCRSARPGTAGRGAGTSPERLRQQRLDVVAEERREHEQAPHAVDDRRNRRQQLDRGAERPLQRRPGTSRSGTARCRSSPARRSASAIAEVTSVP